MIKTIEKPFFFGILTGLFFVTGSIFAQPGLNQKLLKKNWAIQSTAKVSATGDEISKADFKTKKWYPATMPSTILETLVKNGVYKDPYYGNNLTEVGGYFPVTSSMYLYDLPKDSPFSVPWWFRTEFDLPEGDDYVWLHLSSINYKANIWVNGSLITDTNEIEGAHRVYDLDITSKVIRGGKNGLAIEIVTPVNGTDMSIRWMQGSRMVPDKDAGIWYNVKLIRNGAIKIRYPYVITDLNLPDTTIAYLTVKADIYNNSENPVQGELQGNIVPVNNIPEGGSSSGGPDNFKFSEKMRLKPHETKQVRINVKMDNPALWWPNGSGKQNLYDLNLTMIDQSGEITDKNSIRFGVREITSTLEDYFPEVDQKLVRVFQVNGKNIFIKGGNWTETIMMEENPERNEAEVLHMLNMNFNAIRTEGFWGTDHFFDLCDKYGIMIFDGFNCCSIWERWDAWTERSYEIAGLSFRDQIIRKRNHPAFVDWLLGSDNSVPFRVEKMYVDTLSKYDGTRPYQNNSMYSTTPFCGCSGIDHDPYPDTYIYLHPTTWYGMKKLNENGDYGPYEFLEFNTEVSPGGEQIPPMESMRSMMPKEDLWPISKTWELRQSSDAYSVNATKIFDYRYGKPVDLESYTVKAQAFQKEAFRAMVEAFRKNKYKASGILIYRVNAGWPSLCYFLYDYYLRPNGAYAGVKQGFEPLHVQYSYDDSTIVVVNDFYKGFKDLKVTARVLNLDMTEKYTRTIILNIDEDGVKTAFTLPLKIEGLSETYFLDVKLEDRNSQLISSNFYWLSVKHDTVADYSDLENLPTIGIIAEASFEDNGANSKLKVKITNPTRQLAFFINPKVLKGLHGEELLPAYWSAKYFSLLPNETREIEVEFDKKSLNGNKPYLLLEGWNTDPVEISLSGNEEVTPLYKYNKMKTIKSVTSGQKFSVKLNVKNSAKQGSALLKSRQYLFVDGKPVSYRRVALAPGEEKQLTWNSLKIDSAGSHEIKVGNMKPVRIIVK
jgi:exo-1,4-beta-D-glucosaminidase